MERHQPLKHMVDQHHQALQEVSAPFLQAFGASQLCFDCVLPDGNFWVINTHPDLYKYYIEQHGWLYDPTVPGNARSDLGGTDLFVWNACEEQHYKNKVLVGFGGHFGVTQGVSFIHELSDGGTLSISFGGDEQHPSMVPKLVREKRLVNDFVFYLQDELSDEIADLNQHLFPLMQYQKDVVWERRKQSLKLSVQQKARLLLMMKKINDDDLWLTRVSLTAKQAQCGELYLRGLSTREIALLMDIGEPSVKDHISGLKKKLKAGGKDQLLNQLDLMKDLGLLDNEYINLR